MPCTPNMMGCKASCAHKAFVMGYREERYRQEMELVEKSMGYDTEMADNKRVMTEQGRPMITFRDWLKHSKREPMPEIPDPTLTMNYGNQQAEESLLAIAMATPNAVPYLRELGPEEFHTPLANEIYKAIIDLEDRGERATGFAVEGELRARGIGASPEWDSSFAWGEDVERFKQGLRGWEYTAAPILLAPVFQDEIRTHYQAHQVERIHTWAAETMRGVIDQGPTPGKISWVQNQVKDQMSKVKPSFSQPSASLTPAPSLHRAPARTTPSRARA